MDEEPAADIILTIPEKCINETRDVMKAILHTTQDQTLKMTLYQNLMVSMETLLQAVKLGGNPENAGRFLQCVRVVIEEATGIHPPPPVSVTNRKRKMNTACFSSSVK